MPSMASGALDVVISFSETMDNTQDNEEDSQGADMECIWGREAQEAQEL